MQLKLEVLDGLKRKLTVTLPSEMVDPEVEMRLKKMVPKVNEKGFRPGKVPYSVVKNKYGASVRLEVLSDLINKTWPEAVKTEDLKPACAPNVQITHSVPGEPVAYEALFEVYPTITLNPLNDVELEDVTVEVSEQDVTDLIEKLQRQQATWEPTDAPAQMGDRVSIDFEGTIDGQPFEGSAAKNLTLELGSGSAIAGFEEGLVGVTPSEQFINLHLNMPQDYLRKDLAGKETHIKVWVHQVLHPTLPPIDEAFIAKMGVKEGGLEALRKDVREKLEKELLTDSRQRLKNQLLDQFVRRNPIDVPEGLVDAEIQVMQDQFKAQWQARGKSKVTIADLPKEHFLETARRRVILAILFREFLRVSELKLDTAEVQAKLDLLASPYKDKEKVKQWMQSDQRQMAHIEALVIEDQIAEELLKQVRLVGVVKPYSELKRPVSITA